MCWQTEFDHVTTIPLGFKKGFAPGQAADWRRAYQYDFSILGGERPYLWNFVGNALASGVRIDMLRTIDRHWEWLGQFGPGIANLTSMWSDSLRGMRTPDYRQVLSIHSPVLLYCSPSVPGVPVACALCPGVSQSKLHTRYAHTTPTHSSSCPHNDAMHTTRALYTSIVVLSRT